MSNDPSDRLAGTAHRRERVLEADGDRLEGRRTLALPGDLREVGLGEGCEDVPLRREEAPQVRDALPDRDEVLDKCRRPVSRSATASSTSASSSIASSAGSS